MKITGINNNFLYGYNKLSFGSSNAKTADTTAQTPKILTEEFGGKGLTRYLKSHWVDAPQLVRILEEYPDVSRNIGSPPKGWLDNVPEGKRKETVLAIFDTCAEFSSKISPFYEEDAEFQPLVEEFEGRLCETLGKKVKVKYITKGTVGNVFSIEADDKKYVIKSFRKDAGTGNGHGRSEEPQKAIFVKNNERKSRFAEFYFGRVATREEQDGFIVTEYVDQQKRTGKKSPYDMPYITSNDSNAANLIGTKGVDFGDLSIDKGLIDPKVRKHARILTQLLETKKQEEVLRYIKKYMDDPKLVESLKQIEWATGWQTCFSWENYLLAAGSDSPEPIDY